MAAPSILFQRSDAGIRFARVPVPWTERAAAAVALAAIAPGLAGAMGAVRWLSGRSPLVAHRRAGQNGRVLWVLKLRTMWPAGPASGASDRWIEYLQEPVVPTAKDGADPRVSSRFAAFCRRHSIDEFPQLLHVARGEMRFAGPRPMTQQELQEHYGPVADEILSVPPGLTGLWQVMGRNGLSYAQRRRLDLFFVRHRTWTLSARILLRTVTEIVHPRDAW